MNIDLKFYPGDKVLCLSDDEPPKWEKGEIEAVVITVEQGPTEKGITGLDVCLKYSVYIDGITHDDIEGFELRHNQFTY